MAENGKTGRAHAHRRYTWAEGLRRLARYRLVVPLRRSIHSPEHTARGVMVGMVWAMTPTVGLQMPLVFVTWLVARRLFRWDFSVVIGMVWTWTTNLVTLVPALLGVRLSVFVIATFFGIIPGTFVFALAGSGLGSALEASADFSVAAVLTPEIIAALVGLAVLALVPVLYKKFRRRHGR